MRSRIAERAKSAKHVLKSGVKFAASSDWSWFYPGKTSGGASTAIFIHLREAGRPTLDVTRGFLSMLQKCWAGRIESV